MARIAIFGAGYVGLVTGACFAELGHEVVVRDILPEKIDALRRGEVPIYEPGLEELLVENAERLRYTLDVREALDGAEFVYICVDTPPLYSGDADLSRVWTVVDELPADTRATIVMKSTVPVGTGEKVRAALDARGLASVGYVSNPEFTAEGTAVRDFMEPDRIVVGALDEADGDAVAALHAGIDAPVVRADVNSAEMIKLAANAFLMTRVSFVNEIANVCELVGADVQAVAEGVGLDHRLGPHFLRAGLGYGGSCLAGDESLLVRRDGRSQLTTLADLFASLVEDDDDEVVCPTGVEVLSWRTGADRPEFLPVAIATRRPYYGDLVEVRTKMGRRVRCTPDHPFVVGDGTTPAVDVKLAEALTNGDWLPIAQGAPHVETSPRELKLAHLIGREVATGATEPVSTTPIVTSGEGGAEPLRLVSGRERTSVPASIEADAEFWRVVGLYIAEGHCSWNRSTRRLFWSFHPTKERHLAKEVHAFWHRHGVTAILMRAPTALHVVVSSRVLAAWWLDELGMGRNAYDQRLPDLIWQAPEAMKGSVLNGLWLGDGSWSYVNRGPSVVLEYGTVSKTLADGIMRLLGDLRIVSRLKVGRTRKSTCETYWLVISGAEQVERLLGFIPDADEAALRHALRRTKRIAPTGYRRIGGTAWARIDAIERRSFSGFVYSLEVPDSHTFVTTGGLIVDNCFPKDSLALKQLAANSGYHFQLLTAVIEVNELQKRRVIQKLQKHLGKLRGKRVALLGLAFKPNTDDTREAPSLVLASRLLAEGAEVRGWDPIARPELPGAMLCASPLEAVAGADAAVIVTEWPELKELATEETRAAMRHPLIIDGRNLLDPDSVRAAGFAYEGIGRAVSPLDVLPETPEREPEPSA